MRIMSEEAYRYAAALDRESSYQRNETLVRLAETTARSMKEVDVVNNRTVWIKPWLFRMPSLPNFLTEVKSELAVDIALLSNEALEAIGQEWAKALLDHAKVRRQRIEDSK